MLVCILLCGLPLLPVTHTLGGNTVMKPQLLYNILATVGHQTGATLKLYTIIFKITP